MTTRVDSEEITSTRSEKILAVVLAIFVLIGTTWFYVKIDDWISQSSPAYNYTTTEQDAIDAATSAWEISARAAEKRDQALTQLELNREDLRLAMEQKTPTAALQKKYDESQAAYAKAKSAAEQAGQAADAAQEKADRAQETYDQRTTDRRDGRYWLTALVRILLIAALLIGSLQLTNAQRSRNSRYLSLGLSSVVAAAVMAVVFAVDYITDYVAILDLGPIVLSLLGIAATIAGFAALQKHLARRVTRSRVRHGDCPFCGFPVRGDEPHCSGCGREVVAACSNCSQPRRVGTAFCRHCGSAH